MLTVIGLTYGFLLGGSVVVEFVFDWPGPGESGSGKTVSAMACLGHGLPRRGTAAEEFPGRRARLSPYAKGAVSRQLEGLGELKMQGGETETSRSETDRPAPRVAQGS